MSGGSVSFTAGALIATVLAIALALIAGIRSVAWTDAFQALIMIVTSVGVVWVVAQGLGGFDSLFSALERDYPEWLTVPGNGFFSFATFLGLTLPWFFFSISNPQVSQRLFMLSSLAEMRRMLLLFLGYGLIYTLVAILWGFSALVQSPDLENPDLATPTLLSSPLVPPVLGVIVMIGILAAAISTIDSILLTLSSLVARDVYEISAGRKAPVQQLRVGRWVIPLIALLACGLPSCSWFDRRAVRLFFGGLLVMFPHCRRFWRKGTAERFSPPSWSAGTVGDLPGADEDQAPGASPPAFWACQHPRPVCRRQSRHGGACSEGGALCRRHPPVDPREGRLTGAAPHDEPVSALPFGRPEGAAWAGGHTQ